jgi:transglutaminase/protease-like cytokinesis protein 3
VEKLDGFAKGFGYKIGEPLSTPNHAWNAVRIDGNWYLLDATWDAGVVGEKSNKFEFKN